MSNEGREGSSGSSKKENMLSRSSSIGPQTREVLSMKEQVAAGRPISAYEFAQGMVDYGKDYQPPPRIYIVYDDDRSEVFTGKLGSREGIKAIEFTNSGPGLTPEDTVIIHHDPDVDTTLGQHGRGTTITLTYLESQGMHTEVESNATDPKTGTDARAWKVSTSLRDTESGKTKTVHVEGEWLDKTSNETVFRVLEPTGSFLDQLDKLPEFFLPANANSPDALVVDKDPQAPQVPLSYELRDPRTGKSARIQCLSGIVPYSESDRSTVYVDGLKVKQRYSSDKCLFPWDISGARDLSENLQVGRSPDSGSVDGRGKVETLLQIALRHNKDPKVYTELLAVAEDLADQSYGAPSELDSAGTRNIPYELRAFSDKSKKLLLQIWKEKHGDAYLANSKKAVAKFGKSGSTGHAVAVQETMYAWLKEAGVKTVEDAGIVEAESVRTGNDIQVDYANSADRLEKLFQEIGEFEGVVKVVDINGKKGVEIRFPYSIHEAQDFADRKKPAAQLARVAAIIAGKEALEIAIRSRRGTEDADMEFSIREWSNNKFNTELEVAKREGQPLKAELAAGLTSIVLTGDKLQQLEPPVAADLSSVAQQEALAAMQRKAERLASLPIRAREKVEPSTVESSGQPQRKKHERPARRIKQPNISRRAFLLGSAAVVGSAVALHYKDNLLNLLPDTLSKNDYEKRYEGINPNKISIGDTIGVDHGGIGVHEPDYRSSPEIHKQLIAYERGNMKRGVEGYYREFVGSKFIADGSGRGRWISVENYGDQPVPLEKPKRYLSKINLAGVNGQVRLPIRTGEKVSAIDAKTPVTIKRENRTGNYVIQGLLGEKIVSIYTSEDSPNSIAPLPVESESMLDFQSLNPDWQSLLAFVRTQEALSSSQKAALILEKWSKGFTYSRNSQYDVLAKGRDAKQIATQIVNGRVGMCNFAAVGIVALWREAGIPAREVTGKMVDRYGGEGFPHAWAEFWNGQEWQEGEPLLGSKNDGSSDNRTEAVAGYLDSLPRSAQAESTEALLRQNAQLLDQHRELLENKPNISQSSKPKEVVASPQPIREKKGDDGWFTLKTIVPAAVTGVTTWFLGRRSEQKKVANKKDEENT